MATDEQLLESLRAGDEGAFAELVARYSGALLRVARMYVSSEAVAQEVVQETWIGVIRGPRSLRGPLVAEDLDLSNPHQHRQDARPARGP